MIVLTIYHADGSVHWVEHFNDMASAQAWIAEEQTRPYWDASWTFTIVDNTPAPTAPDLMAALRVRRDALLTASDWTQLADAPASIDRAAWAAYRQALRDLPDSPGLDPANPTWPTEPQS